jgi:hypothetical protein
MAQKGGDIDLLTTVVVGARPTKYGLGVKGLASDYASPQTSLFDSVFEC